MFTDPAFIQRLETLQLLCRKVLGGSLQANRRSTQKGAGITFADYSEYSFGDDYRAIDWQIYARFEQLVIKLFEVEEDVTLYLLLDASPSMQGKWTYARELAAALAFMALHNHDHVTVDLFADRLDRRVDNMHGGGRVFQLLQRLDEATCFGADSELLVAAKAFQARAKKKGLVVVISDLLFPEGIGPAADLLQWHGHELFCLQVQDDQDRLCAARGDVELTCVETGQRRQVTVTPELATRYQRLVEELNMQARQHCAKRGIGFVSETPATPFDTVIQNILRRGGLVA